MPNQSSQSFLASMFKSPLQFMCVNKANIPLLIAVFIVYMLPGSHCTFQRTDWQPITTVLKNTFTVCGVDIGPVYADLKTIHLWTYDSVSITNGTVSLFACSKYGHLLQREGDPVYLAALLSFPAQIELFRIEDSTKLEQFDYTITRKEYFRILTINLERDRLFVLYQQFNVTSTLVDVYDLSSQQQTLLMTIRLPNANCNDMRVDYSLNIGVFCTSSKTFMLYYGELYQQFTSLYINQNEACHYTWYNYSRMEYQKYQTYEDDSEVEFFTQAKFQVIFEGPTKGSMTCSVEVDVNKYTAEPKEVMLSSVKVDGEPSIFCDGRNFYYISYQNSIDSSSLPVFYADVTIDQTIELALCVRFSHPLWFLDDNVKFYILSSNVTYPNYYNYFIDQYAEVNVGTWFLFSLCCLVLCCTCLILCITGKIFDLLSFFCCDPFSDEVKNGLVSQLEL